MVPKGLNAWPVPDLAIEGAVILCSRRGELEGSLIATLSLVLVRAI